MKREAIRNNLIRFEGIKEFLCKMRVKPIKKKKSMCALPYLPSLLFEVLHSLKTDLIVVKARLAKGNKVTIRKIRKVPLNIEKSSDNNHWWEDASGTVNCLDKSKRFAIVRRCKEMPFIWAKCNNPLVLAYSNSKISLVKIPKCQPNGSHTL